MKKKNYRILGVGLTLALLTSLLLTASPVLAAEVSELDADTSPDEISLEGDYTISFRLNKALLQPDTITVRFPEDTDVSTADVANTTVSATSGIGSAAIDGLKPEGLGTNGDVTAVKDDRTVTITLPDANDVPSGYVAADGIGAMAYVQLVIPDVTNPSEPGEYTLELKTSEETTYVESESYEIEVPVVGGPVYVYNPSDILIAFYGGSAALNNAQDDGYFDRDDYTITVGPGTYVLWCDLTITGKGVTLESSDGAADTIIDCGIGTGTRYSIQITTAKGITIDGFTIDDADEAIIINFEDATVTNCVITDASVAGIRIDPAGTDATVSDNVIEDCKIGVHFNAVGATDYGDVDIIGNTITETIGNGGIVFKDGSTDIDIAGNTITGNDDSGIYFADGDAACVDIKIEGNTISENEGNGIRLYNSSNNAISRNTISENEENGIRLYNSSNNTLANNIVAVNSGYGIYLFDSSNNTLTNNTVVSNSGYGIRFEFTSANNAIKNAILWGNSDDLYGGIATYSNIEDDDPGEGNISADPMFVDTAGGDYHLKIGSPCIDKGIDVGAPTEDIEGNVRPIDGNGDSVAVTDMGAYEYVPPAEPAIEATIDFDPDTLNLKSKGKVVTVYIELPEGYDVEKTDISTVMLNGIVPALAHPTDAGDYDSDGVPDLMVKFDRSDVQDVLEPGNEVEVTVTGKLTDGTPFEGTDTIRVIEKEKK